MLRLIRQFRYFQAHPLTRSRPMAAMQRFVVWQLKSRMTREHTFDWVGGSRLLVRRGMTGATGNIYCGLHECVDMAFMLHLLRPGDLFGDIGANIGSYSVLASKVCGARVVAVEPDPLTAHSLIANLHLNQVQSTTAVVRTAVGDHEGSISFTVGLDTMNRVSSEDSGAPGQTVPLTTLDSLFKDETPVMLKVDVEGFEDAVFRGAQRLLADPALLAVQSECQNAAVQRQLLAHGFEEWHYDPFRRKLASTRNLEHSNGLYLRNIEFVRQRLETARQVQVLDHIL